MMMVVIIYAGLIAEGHEVLSSWSIISYWCVSTTTIYFRNIQLSSSIVSIAWHHSTLECQIILASASQPANSTHLCSATIIINIIYNINPAYYTWLASMCCPIANTWYWQFLCWWNGWSPSLQAQSDDA